MIQDTDLIMIERGGVLYRATIADLPSGGGGVPTVVNDSETFNVNANQQVLYSFPIDLGVNAMIDFDANSVMVEVN